MKDKELKKMLSENADRVLPDDGVKREIKHRLAIDDEVSMPAGGVKAKRANKTPFIAAAVFVLICAIVCAVLIPYYLDRGGNTVVPSPIDKFAAIDGADDFYVYGAASVGALLSAQTDGAAATVSASSLKTAAKSKAAKTSKTTDEIAEILDEYMSFVEGLLGGSQITHEQQVVEGGDYSQYQYQLVIGYPHVDGGYSTYILYYNRLTGTSKTDGGGTEEKYDIEGVLSVNGVDYNVDGKYEYETESGETEEALSFTVYDSDGYPYIKLEQETEQEDGESELGYMYTFYSGGKAVKSVEVEYEQEDGETEVSLTVKEGTDKYEFTFLLTGGNTMTVKAEVNGVKYTIKVTADDGKYSYVFK